MRVQKLSIRNIKAIPTLDILFQERIALLHGANGIGKSTILDCLALLGHLTTMRRLVVGKGGTDLHSPILFERLRARTNLDPAIKARIDEIEKKVPDQCKAIRDALKAGVSIDRWFEDSYLRIPRIRYELETSITGQSSSINMVVAMIGPEDLTVSHVLNRTRCDDLDMAENLVVLTENDQCVDRFLDYQADASTTMVKDSAGSFTAIPPRQTDGISGNRVVAINTDLADLGKRDQIRESVKDINLYLADEITRLNLPFDQPVAPQRMRFRFFDDLSAILSHVITDPALAKRTANKRPFLTLTSCDVDDGRPKIAIRRGDEHQSLGTDFLSAGENECFFVFLALLGIDTQSSIIILDEPELHIAEYCRPAFFEALYELTKTRACQVIVATHSLFALTDKEPAQFLVVGRTVGSGGTLRYTCGPNPEYSLSLFKAYWRTGTLFLATAGSAQPFRALAAAAYSSLERLGKERPIPVALLVGAMGSAIVALASDVANFSNLQTGPQHIFMIRVVVSFGVLVTIASGLLFWAFRRGRK